MTTFRERLAWAREAGALTQRELSLLAGLSGSHVWALETTHAKLHRGIPSFQTLQKLCNVLGVSVEWLVEGTGAKPKADDVAATVKRVQRAAERRATGS